MRRLGALLTIGAALGLAMCFSAGTAQAGIGLPSPAIPEAGPLIWTSGFLGRSDQGWVQHDPVVYLVFWGANWRTDTSGIVPAEIALFRELAGTSYNAILGQYGVHNDVRLARVYFDPSTPPVAGRLTSMGVAREASRARAVVHGRAGMNAQWVILPQAGTNLGNFSWECGEHDANYVGRGHHRRLYVTALIQPFQDWSADCTYDYSTNDGQVQPSDPVAATTSLTTHEYAEAATDPNGAGWITAPVFGNEIADLCYFYAGTPAGLTVNVSYLWSNALHDKRYGCVL